MQEIEQCQLLSSQPTVPYFSQNSVAKMEALLFNYTVINSVAFRFSAKIVIYVF